MAFWNHSAGIKGFFFSWRGRWGDIVMHVLRKLYKESCPGAYRLMCCGACPSALEIFCSQSAKSTEPARIRNIILDAMPGDFCVGATWHVQAYAETESVVIGPPRWSRMYSFWFWWYM